MSENLEQRVNSILDGIDKTEVEHENGWWETSTGAIFGAGILGQIKELIAEIKENAENLKFDLEKAEEESERLREVINKISNEAHKHVNENGHGPGRLIIGIADDALTLGKK